MDGNLFKKYENSIKKNKNNKESILLYIQEKTGVILNEKEITIINKKIKITTSSTQRSILLTRNIKEIILEKGYYLV
ncbi:MAG: hypothetical protein KBC21_00655 [Candidatus Pacebacteria bacterium]|nr:hypothetical protein [Candidatus Paceibacterota bacterium]